MAYPARLGQANLPSLIVMTGLFGWGAMQAGPIIVAGHIQFLPGILAGIGAIFGLRLSMELLTRFAQVCDWISSYEATGKGGTAKWASRKQIKAELIMKEDRDE